MSKTTFIIVKRSRSSGMLAAAPNPHEHSDQDAAEKEAERLSRLEEGAEFIVFEAVASAVYQPVMIKRFRKTDLDTDLPF